MIAVIFEVHPNKDGKQQYLDTAASLRPLLEKIDGFISVERFQSMTDESKLLSLSFFRDEASVKTWRELEKHRAAQAAGRSELFDDYRIRIAHVIRDYGMEERKQAPCNTEQSQ